METIIVFVFGLIYGSFLNVVILRFDDWRSIMTGRSHCPECKAPLTWIDLIPVVSYLSLKGRCRYCQKPISWQYPVVEVATAFFLAGGYLSIFANGSLTVVWQIIAFVLFIVVIGCLVAMFFHDLIEMMIPDFFGYVLLFSALVFSLIFYQNPLHTLYGGLIGFLPIALLVYPSRGKWMGEGDLKLAAGLGLLVGYPHAIVFIALAFMIGGLYGLALTVIGKAKLSSAVPFGPFLITAGLIALFWGQTVIDWYLGKLGL